MLTPNTTRTVSKVLTDLGLPWKIVETWDKKFRTLRPWQRQAVEMGRDGRNIVYG